jgi:SAM-dependent methyltransferase
MNTSYEILKRHREIWKKKKVLRDIYHDWYRLIIENIVENGHTLEIGAGGGNLKEYYPNLIASDYTYCEWLDVILDAQRLPFHDSSLRNIIMVDVLHHLEYPTLFLKEAQRVLKNNGRLIMFEPYISPFSYLTYHYLHQEDVDFKVDIFHQEKTALDFQKKPFDGNSAIPTIIFFKEIEKFKQKFPPLQIVKQKLLSIILYPLSGGFEHKCFIPNWSVPFFLIFERVLLPFSKLFAFRMFLVLELKL